MTTNVLEMPRNALKGAPGALLTEPGDVAPYARDWLGRRQWVSLAVVRPATAAEVASVLRVCADAGFGVVPQGGNTGMVGGATPGTGGRQLVLSLSRMNRIRGVDPVGDIVVAEAGCTVASVKAAVRGAATEHALGAAGKHAGGAGQCRHEPEARHRTAAAAARGVHAAR